MTLLEPSHTRLSDTARHTDPLVRTRSSDGVLILTCTGDSLDDPIAGDLADICLGYAEPGGGAWTNQALSLGMIHRVTCAGFRSLVEISDGLSARNGRLVLFGVGRDVRAVVHRTGLEARLVIARTEQEAVARSRTDGQADDRPFPFSLGSGFGLFRAA